MRSRHPPIRQPYKTRVEFRQVSPNSSHPPPCQPNRANLQKCINQTGLFPSLTVSAESDLCDKNQAALNALPQLPFPGKCINFVGGWTGLSSLYQINKDRCPIIWKLFFLFLPYGASISCFAPTCVPSAFCRKSMQGSEK